MLKSRFALALLCIAVSLYLFSIASGFIPTSDEQAHAPLWVIGLCGVVFLIGGCMILLGRHSRVNDLLAAILCAIFGVVGLWVSLFSSSEGFSGGIPFLSYEQNVTIARWVFGLGSLISFAIAAYAFRRSIR